ncbi:hypothetical protein VTN49DRAFT_5059 [Thermomyces lanuginosus]|uniref:uncharacterized protein n=1 Tax=Thermomyces lanuginosus TaxID=5541 RepID=UPI0037423F1C
METDGAEGRTCVIEATCVTGWKGLERIALSIYLSISNIPLFLFSFDFSFVIHLRLRCSCLRWMLWDLFTPYFFFQF